MPTATKKINNQPKQQRQLNQTKQQKQPKQPKEKIYLTAVTIVGGIITLIDENGDIRYYRQRGIDKISKADRQLLIASGMLQLQWEQFPELPKNVSISFEDPTIMGRARVTYPKNILDILKNRR